jgi:hypothetical protein
MAIPIAFPWTLYTDDDVLVCHDPTYLGMGWCTAHRFDKLTETQWDYDFAEEAGRAILGHGLTPWEFNERTVDFGVWAMPHADGWLELMKEYWSLPTVTRTKRHTNRFRLNDQRFAALYFWRNDWRRLTSVKDRRMVMHTFEKWDKRVDLCKKSTFVHYGCGKHKTAVMNYIREHWDEREQVHEENV